MKLFKRDKTHFGPTRMLQETLQSPTNENVDADGPS